MRKKLLLIVPLALIIATGAYALVANLFPNMESFPRIPMGSGSLGQVLGQILGVTDLTNPGDGTV